ncbi:MAG: hypothetical protein OFPII_02090 [Osedax symbiont Rs1]|nr:MAG: hypothetical protein OFPII_02090 [Osedax symbiont Rs1]
MYFELFDVFLLTLVCLAIYYWLSAQKIREFALKAARTECERLNLQLLDGSVGLNKIRPVRGQAGSLTLKREYNFEFSATGDERYIGKITLLSHRVIDIYLPPHRLV